MAVTVSLVGLAGTVGVVALAVLNRIPRYLLSLTVIPATLFSLWLFYSGTRYGAAQRLPKELQEAEVYNERFERRAEGRSVIDPTDLAVFLDPLTDLDQVLEGERKLGAGAFGQVSLWTYRGKRYAIKDVRDSREAAEREFVTGLTLDHPNILKHHNLLRKYTLDGGVVDRRHYLVMEYFEGF